MNAIPPVKLNLEIETMCPTTCSPTKLKAAHHVQHSVLRRIKNRA